MKIVRMNEIEAIYQCKYCKEYIRTPKTAGEPFCGCKGDENE